MKEFYMTIGDPYGTITFATSMGVCDYRGVYKGVQSHGFHMTACFGVDKGKQEIIRHCKNKHEKYDDYIVRIEVDDVELQSLNHKNSWFEYEKAIDKLFEEENE